MELAGRGRRIHEALNKDTDEMVEDVFMQVKNHIRQGPYALFGHSLGSIMAFMLAQKIMAHGLPEPVHVFFSGQSAPHLKKYDKKYHLMNDADFRREVLALGGTPPEFFQHPELLELFLPLLKNDFKMAETELDVRRSRPLNCDISVLIGKDDDLTREQCDGWKIHTHQRCNIHYFDGGHFFLHSKTADIARLINDTIRKQLQEAPLARSQAGYNNIEQP